MDPVVVLWAPGLSPTMVGRLLWVGSQEWVEVSEKKIESPEAAALIPT